MTCTTAHRLVQEALESGAPFEAPLQAHLGSCSSCKSYAERLQRSDPSGARKSRALQAPPWMPLVVVGIAVLIVLTLGRHDGPTGFNLPPMLLNWLHQAKRLLSF